MRGKHDITSSKCDHEISRIQSWNVASRRDSMMRNSIKHGSPSEITLHCIANRIIDEEIIHGISVPIPKSGPVVGSLEREHEGRMKRS